MGKDLDEGPVTTEVTAEVKPENAGLPDVVASGVVNAVDGLADGMKKSVDKVVENAYVRVLAAVKARCAASSDRFLQDVLKEGSSFEVVHRDLLIMLRSMLESEKSFSEGTINKITDSVMEYFKERYNLLNRGLRMKIANAACND